MSRKQNGSEMASFAGGMLIGLMLSAPIAAWLSPRSGAETRQEIRQRGVVIRRKATQAVQAPVRQAQSQIEQLQTKVEQMKGDSIEDALQEGKAIAVQKKVESQS